MIGAAKTWHPIDLTVLGFVENLFFGHWFPKTLTLTENRKSLDG